MKEMGNIAGRDDTTTSAKTMYLALIIYFVHTIKITSNKYKDPINNSLVAKRQNPVKAQLNIKRLK